MAAYSPHLESRAAKISASSGSTSRRSSPGEPRDCTALLQEEPTGPCPINAPLIRRPPASRYLPLMKSAVAPGMLGLRSFARQGRRGDVMRLDGKVALITGAGSGMGRVAAQMFAREGARVVAADLDEQAGQETAALARDEGLDVRFVQADVSREADCRAMVACAEETFGTLDVLYNNAGIFPEADHSVIDTDE